MKRAEAISRYERPLSVRGDNWSTGWYSDVRKSAAYWSYRFVDASASLNRNTDVFLIYGRLDVCIPFSKIEAPKQSLLQFFSRIKAFSFFTALFISVMLYILLLLTKRSRNSAFQENSFEKI